VDGPDVTLPTAAATRPRLPRTGRRPAAVRLLLPLVCLLLNGGLAQAAGTAQLPGSMGLLDVASPVFSWVDNTLLGWLPVWVRVIAWAALASVISMGIYRVASRQEALDEVKSQVLATRAQLQGFEGDFKDLWPILKQNLGLAGRQLGMTFVPAMVASLPVLFILAWMSNAFDAREPAAGAPVAVTLTAAEGRTLPPLTWRGDGQATQTAPGAWNVTWPAAGSKIELAGTDGSTVLTLPTATPVRTVAQWEWWNRLIGNPGGYLASPGDVAAAHIDLPQPTVFPFGPDWLRGWLPAMLVVLMGLSLYLKFAWRLH
jgi:hypothetical protein